MTTEQPQHKFEDDDGIMECVNCGRHPSEGKEPCSIPDVKTRAVTTERGRREELRPWLCGETPGAWFKTLLVPLCCRDCEQTALVHARELYEEKSQESDRLESLCRKLAGALKEIEGGVDYYEEPHEAKFIAEKALAKYRAEMGETI